MFKDMQSKWLTKEKDLEAAQNIIEEYARIHDGDSLGIFEVTVREDKEVPDVRLAEWVVNITDYFQEKYGPDQGDFVTKMVISRCLTQGNIIH